MSKEIFNRLEIPYSFSNRGEAAAITDGIRAHEMALGELEQSKLHRINAVLNHPELDSLIGEGKITLGLIKPRVNISKGLPSNDQEAAEKIMDEIGRENVVFSFSTKFNSADVERFYAEAKEKYPEEIWRSIFEYSQSGPLTFLLIYRERGDAISWWRTKMGKTHPAQADPESIRGKYGIEEELPKNLVHGSDSVESVRKELSELKRITSELEAESLTVKKSMPSERSIKRLLEVEGKDEIYAVQRYQVEEVGSKRLCIHARVYPHDKGRRNRSGIFRLLGGLSA